MSEQTCGGCHWRIRGCCFLNPPQLVPDQVKRWGRVHTYMLNARPAVEEDDPGCEAWAKPQDQDQPEQRSFR